MNTPNTLHIEIQTTKEKPKSIDQNDTKNKLSNFCLDVAKYILSGVFITTVFALINNAIWIVLVCGLLIAAFFSLGITLNKIK